MLASPSGFSANQRLRTSAEFGTVFANPTRAADALFTLLGRANGRPIARLGLTVSRRTAKRAVDRNRLKRLAREAFRLQVDLPPWDFIVLARPGAKSADNRTLRASLDRLFARLKSAANAGRNG